MSERRPLALPDEVTGGRTVVSRVVAILMTFLYGRDQTLTEIAAATGMPLSTVHRLVCDLAACGLLRRGESGRYEIAPPLRRVAVTGGPLTSLENRASLVLQDLSEELDTEVRFGVLRRQRVAYIEKPRGRRPTTTFADGATVPAHGSALGLVMLAFSPRSVVDAAVLEALASSDVGAVASVERFLPTLRRVRLRGLAVMWNEHDPDRSALAVPVLAAGGQIVGALEARVGGPSTQLAVVRSALAVAGRSLARELSSAVRLRGPRLDLPAVAPEATAVQLSSSSGRSR